MRRRKSNSTVILGVTLVELLVAVSLVSLLISLLLPGLTGAREQARAAVCRSNMQQIILANEYYAHENSGVYVAGAAEFLRNLDRWHGRRATVQDVFDGRHGPLAVYLGDDGAIRQCPSFPIEDIAKHSGGFERGNGGYGYNNRYVGVRGRHQQDGSFITDDDRTGVARDRIARPGATIMFADAAFVDVGLVEYSFAEPRFHPQYPAFRADPSIHFRHRGHANVGWCDGHVDGQQRTFTWSSGMYSSDPARYDIGWFGEADNNDWFDLR
jgi:prepilin-type processing-associated H-X9-DG protein